MGNFSGRQKSKGVGGETWTKEDAGESKIDGDKTGNRLVFGHVQGNNPGHWRGR